MSKNLFSEPFVRKNVPLDELLIGELLDFSTLTCPSLAKSWFRFADWAYGWGRQLLARSVPYVLSWMYSIGNLISNYRRLSSLDFGQQVRTILPPVCRYAMHLLFTEYHDFCYRKWHRMRSMKSLVFYHLFEFWMMMILSSYVSSSFSFLGLSSRVL